MTPTCLRIETCPPDGASGVSTLFESFGYCSPDETVCARIKWTCSMLASRPGKPGSEGVRQESNWCTLYARMLASRSPLYRDFPFIMTIVFGNIVCVALNQSGCLGESVCVNIQGIGKFCAVNLMWGCKQRTILINSMVTNLFLCLVLINSFCPPSE